MMESKKVALVTGANRGIGLETVRQFAAKEIDVYLAARSLSSAKKAAQQLSGSGIKGVDPIKLDVTNASDRIPAAKQIESGFEHLDILINNTALGAPEGTLLLKLTSETPRKNFKKFSTRMFSPCCCHHPLPASGSVLRTTPWRRPR